MRLMPIITAILVSGFLYLLVFERNTLLAFAQSGPAAATEEAEEKAIPMIRVVAFHSTAQTIDSAVILRGRTEAARQVEVRAETSGQVISDPLRKGSFVNAGDLLCELDIGTRQSALDEAIGRREEARARLPEAESRIPEAQARRAEATARVAEAQGRLAEARSRLEEAQINQNAAARLSEGGFASDTRVANADATLESARASVISAEAAVEGARAGIVGADASIESAAASVQSARAGIQAAAAGVAAAEREIERLSITAPFEGLLETDAAELGSLLQPGSACATIIQLDPIKLVGFVPETDVSKVHVGALAGARLASGDEVRGRVTFLSRSADPDTRTFRVEVEVPNADLAIRDGQTAEILVASDGRSAHLLPQSALTLNDGGDLGVRVVDADQKAAFMPVSVLRDTVEGIWLTGLPDAVDVIVVGQEFVIDGVPVDPHFSEVDG
ncbi:efflux RND transporter periplasmic adaptor subunit [Aestuariibius sp. HNIBRBA575]|uniref:efflux RND transporter periplasmic adaptor subunit n=1 Tax=Aestuariibius sp. HNIBRBA575 TaxID=3233343 RepID=UPI0034A3A671